PSHLRAPSVRPQRAAVRSRGPPTTFRAWGSPHAQHRRPVRGGDEQSARPGTRNGPMSTPPNATPDSAVDTQTITPAMESPTRPFYWSVRRELWEYRSIYIAPLAAAAVFLAGFIISTIHLPRKMRELAALDAARQQELIQQPYVFAALLI